MFSSFAAPSPTAEVLGLSAANSSTGTGRLSIIASTKTSDMICLEMCFDDLLIFPELNIASPIHQIILKAFSIKNDCIPQSIYFHYSPGLYP